MFFGGLVFRVGFLAMFLYWLSEKTKWGHERRVQARAIPAGQVKKEFISTVFILFIDAVVLFPDYLYFKFLPHADSNGWNDLFTFVSLFLWMEVYYYVTHRAMHSRLLFWTHKKHHLSTRVNVFSSYSMSVSERLILLAGILSHGFLGFVSPITVFGVSAYFTISFVFSILIHSNLDLKMGRIFTTPRYHSDHHLNFQSNYGLFMPFTDRLFGTKLEPRGSGLGRAKLATAGATARAVSVIALFALTTPLASAAQSTDEPKRPKRIVCVECLNGTIATLKAVSPLKNPPEIDAQTVHALDLGEGYTTRYQWLPGKTARAPLIITYPGFRGGFQSRLATNFRKLHADFFDQGFHALLLQPQSTAESIRDNGAVSLGGVDDAYALVKTVEHLLATRADQITKIYILAGSSTTPGAILGSMRLRALYPERLGGVFISSGISEYSDFIAALRTSEGGISPSTLPSAAFLYPTSVSRVKNILTLDFATMGSPSKLSQKLSIEDAKLKEMPYSEVVHLSYEAHRAWLKSCAQQVLGPVAQSIDYTNTESFYRSLDLLNFLRYVDFPVYWMHAKDDPVADIYHYRRVMAYSGENSPIRGMFLKNGGHAGFAVTFGRPWFACTMNHFFAKTSGGSSQALPNGQSCE